MWFKGLKEGAEAKQHLHSELLEAQGKLQLWLLPACRDGGTGEDTPGPPQRSLDVPGSGLYSS